MTLLVYIPAMQAGFIWDDDEHITDYAPLTEPGGLWKIWFEPEYYYPLTSTVWSAARRLVGLQPLWYHLLTIVLHGLNAILLWRILRRLRAPGAWLAAAIFAVHPVMVQSVAWATELKNCLSGFFYLLAALAWVARERSAGPRRALLYLGALAAFALAVASKTPAVVFVGLLVLWRIWRGGPWSWRTVLGWVPFVAIVSLAAVITIHGQGAMSDGPEWDQTLAERLQLASRAVWFYLGKLAWPFHLSFVYPLWSPRVGSPVAWLPLAGLIAAAAALAWGAARRWPLARVTLLALACYVVSLGPALGFFRIYYQRYSWVADHWQYLAAMAGIPWLVGLAAWALRRWVSPRGRLLSGVVGGAAALVLCAGLTWRQAAVYHDNVTLWTDVIAANPNAAIAYNNLGYEAALAGDYPRAEAWLRMGLRIAPEDPALLTIAASVLLQREAWNEALEMLEVADRKMPGDPEILNNMGMAYSGLGQTDRAIEFYRRAFSLAPGYGAIAGNLVKALLERGRRDEAIHAMDAALARKPGDPLLLRLRGFAAEQ